MSHLQKTEKWRTEKRALMLELLDHPRTGLKESSDTNKTRMELLGILDEMTQIATQSAEAERERWLQRLPEDTISITIEARVDKRVLANRKFVEVRSALQSDGLALYETGKIAIAEILKSF